MARFRGTRAFPERGGFGVGGSGFVDDADDFGEDTGFLVVDHVENSPGRFLDNEVPGDALAKGISGGLSLICEGFIDSDADVIFFSHGG